MLKDTHVVAIIPARGGSKGIPKKNIIDFLGKPLLAWSIEDARNSRLIDAVYVSTDDKEIGEVAERYGAEVIWRPKGISTDFSPSEEALKHAINEISKKYSRTIDYVVFLQATSPLRETSDIDSAIEKILAQDADSLFSAADIGDFLIWRKRGDEFQSVNYDYKHRGMRKDFGKQFVENGSIYIFKPKTLFEYNNRLGGKITISEIELWKSFEVDDQESLEFCKKLYQIHYGQAH